ncbi:MAG: DUF3137 domain-containing protein [Akkermansiaceae bacterium]
MNQSPTDSRTLAQQLQPTLDSLELGRQQALQRIRQGWKRITIGIVATLALSGLVLATAVSINQDGSALAFIPLAVGLAYCIITYSQFNSGHRAIYEYAYKEQVVSGMTRLIQPEVNYSPGRGISESTFKETGLYSSSIDRYHCEDLFAGKIGNTEIMFSEVHAEEQKETTDSDGNTRTYWSDIFKGLMVIVDFNKDFRSWLTIKPDFAEKSFGWIGRKIQNFSPNLVRLENPDFERAFVVHGSDQVEARYILTPDFQERLLELRRWFGNDIRLAFYRSRLHLTIPNDSNWFEPNFNLPAHNLTQMQTFTRQMTSVFRLVEILDLNTRIWTKQ